MRLGRKSWGNFQGQDRRKIPPMLEIQILPYYRSLCHRSLQLLPAPFAVMRSARLPLCTGLSSKLTSQKIWSSRWPSSSAFIGTVGDTRSFSLVIGALYHFDNVSETGLVCDSADAARPMKESTGPEKQR